MLLKEALTVKGIAKSVLPIYLETTAMPPSFLWHICCALGTGGGVVSEPNASEGPRVPDSCSNRLCPS